MNLYGKYPKEWQQKRKTLPKLLRKLIKQGHNKWGYRMKYIKPDGICILATNTTKNEIKLFHSLRKPFHGFWNSS